jgi:quercetin dioxygenase-like cupin family protein
MGVRRVVTGHTPEGKAVVVLDDVVASTPLGNRGSAFTSLWGRDDPAQCPDNGGVPTQSTMFPPPGGSGVGMVEFAPEEDDHHEFVRTSLSPYADPDEPGMHRTPTTDYEVVLEGTIGLELDDGTEVILGPGDVVVQNGTRHRWHNRGDAIARMFAVTVGALHRLEGGRPV